MELTPDSRAMLEIDHLHFEYATRPLFRQFQLTLGAGVSWLRGDNGAGKTTLLKLAAGALTPHAGTLRLRPGHADAIDSKLAPLAYRQHSFYCGGEAPQLPWLTVREFLDLHVALYPASDRTLLNAELDAFKLMTTLSQPLTTLSLGQHKKVQLALALALPVSLLLIDEPFNGLDANAMDYLRRQLADPARRARQCIVLTSHLDPQVPLARTVQL
ncbi:ATP-binding cassette domain-containing protein [Rugamonas sp.]|uniref:ABC transporter ATP-binding protein n=1 Tax=Rugamonas sp. TaxID=1926287 RepID=UPI0025D5F235|nr:ATP-binding cassette domain-containing protein [Rugamonas sp.]